ncbi:hypothetical protein L2E82_25532 [Cichorium intybus]|uniref:Uncharacterized protein n=1 Tax=Cichorium intybus TaxID=13427 RepID=A0ACB9E4B6_CICIN|nr:hypothetical protein L2E82_25532 [Cichorium intybus]
MGNSRLCGQPLSKECQDSKASTLPPESNTSESLLPSERIDWIIVCCGVGSGLVGGVVFGNFLYTRYSDRFKKKKDIWVRPLRNRRRNQGWTFPENWIIVLEETGFAKWVVIIEPKKHGDYRCKYTNKGWRSRENEKQRELPGFEEGVRRMVILDPGSSGAGKVADKVPDGNEKDKFT